MGDASKTNPSRARKRVEVETTSLKWARDGSAFTRCEACNKDVPVGLIDMHSCSLDSRIKMNLEAQIVEKVTEVKKPTERKKAASSEPKAKNSKKEKKVKDPNMPKRAPTAFFLFMEPFCAFFFLERRDGVPLIPFVSLMNPSISVDCEILRDCYEAFAMYCFGRYLVACLGGEKNTIRFMKRQGRLGPTTPLLDHKSERGVVKPPFPMNCLLKPWRLGQWFYQVVKFGIVQYMIIKTLSALLAVFLQAFGLYCEGEFKLDCGSALIL